MTTRPNLFGAALTERLVIGEAWRRSWLDASLAYHGSFSDAEPLLAWCRGAGRPDAGQRSLAVLVDLPPGTTSVIEAIRSAAGKVVLLAPMTMNAAVRAALGSGVDGMITLGDRLAVMGGAIEQLGAGERYASPHAVGLLLDEHRRVPSTGAAGDVSLSTRERAVLQAMVKGLTTKSTGRLLGISAKTVEAHRSRLFLRLGVSTQSEAVARALADRRLLADEALARPVRS